jgi:hypothetical protein
MKHAAIVISVVGCFFAGCTPLSMTDMHVTGTPKPQHFDAGGRVALLGLIAPASLQQFAPFLSDALAAALQAANPRIRASSFQESGNLMNDRDLTSDYGDLVSGFVHSGILERERLRRIGAALGSQYVLLPGVAEFNQTIIDRFETVGLKVFRARVTTLRLWLQLWDTKTGHNLWEATGDVTVVTQLLRVKETIPLDSIAENLWLRMIQDGLLEGRQTTLRTFSDAKPCSQNVGCSANAATDELTPGSERETGEFYPY